MFGGEVIAYHRHHAYLSEVTGGQRKISSRPAENVFGMARGRSNRVKRNGTDYQNAHESPRYLVGCGCRSRCAAKSDIQRLATNDYFTYFPTISFNFSFVADGILSRSVKMACANADPHLQDRVFGRPATVALTTLAAFSAFFTSTAMI